MQESWVKGQRQIKSRSGKICARNVIFLFSSKLFSGSRNKIWNLKVELRVRAFTCSVFKFHLRVTNIFWNRLAKCNDNRQVGTLIVMSVPPSWIIFSLSPVVNFNQREWPIKWAWEKLTGCHDHTRSRTCGWAAHRADYSKYGLDSTQLSSLLSFELTFQDVCNQWKMMINRL